VHWLAKVKLEEVEIVRVEVVEIEIEEVEWEKQLSNARRSCFWITFHLKCKGRQVQGV